MQTSTGRTIRILRTAKGVKLGDLAREAGLSIAFLSLVENGERQPSLEALRKIARVLNVPAEALVLMAMGGDSALRSSDQRTADLTNRVEELIRVEDRLREMLNDPAGDAGGTA